MYRRIPAAGHAHEIASNLSVSAGVRGRGGIQRRDRDTGHRPRSPHAGDRMSGQQLDASPPQLRAPGVRQLRTDIDQGHAQAGVGEVESGVVGGVVVGEHHRTGPWPHRVTVDVALGRRCEHYPRTVVVPEHERALVGPGGEHDLLRTHLPQALADPAAPLAMREVVDTVLEHGEVVVIVVTESRGSRQYSHLFHRCETGHHGRHPLVRRRVIDHLAGARQMTARFGPLVDHEHPRAGPARSMRGRQPARTGADDQNVAVRVRLVVGVRIRSGRGTTKPRRATDEVLVLHPPLSGPHECLVVEPGGNHGAEQTVHRAGVEPHARPAVLACGGQTVVDLHLGRPRIRLADRAGAELNQRVGLLDSVSDDPARAVILEAASDQAHAMGEERGGEGVAGIAGISITVEREAHGIPAVDASTGRQPEARDRHRLLPDGAAAPGGDSPMRYTAVISWVTVSRSTLNHRRQPAS